MVEVDDHGATKDRMKMDPKTRLETRVYRKISDLIPGALIDSEDLARLRSYGALTPDGVLELMSIHFETIVKNTAPTLVDLTLGIRQGAKELWPGDDEASIFAWARNWIDFASDNKSSAQSIRLLAGTCTAADFSTRYPNVTLRMDRPARPHIGDLVDAVSPDGRRRCGYVIQIAGPSLDDCGQTLYSVTLSDSIAKWK